MGEVKYHFDVAQGTDEWLSLRMGKLTASEFKNIITPEKLKLSTGKETKTHLDDLLSQRIDPTKRYSTYYGDDMARGHDDELYAIEAYEERYGVKVQFCGFITNEKSGGTLGYSPDGLVGDEGLIEIKSRNPKLQTKTILDHIAGRLNDLIPSEFMMQCQAGLFVSERKWVDFISYCNGHHMVTIRVEPIPEYQDAIHAAATECEKIIQENYQKYMFALDNDPRLTPTIRREIEEMIG